MFGKLVDGKIEYAPSYLKKDGKDIFNYNLESNSAMLIADGYKIVVDSVAPADMKEPRKVWKETVDKITATWIDDYIEPTIEEQNEAIRQTRESLYQQQTDGLTLRKLRKQTLGTWTDEDEAEYVQLLKDISEQIDVENPYIEE